jgi:hypothetical protein
MPYGENVEPRLAFIQPQPEQQSALVLDYRTQFSIEKPTD